MNRISFLLLVTLSTVFSTGCVYMKDRAWDFTDIFILEAHVGYGLSAEIEATKFFGAIAGYSEVKVYGWYGHKNYGSYDELELTFIGIGVFGMISKPIFLGEPWKISFGPVNAMTFAKLMMAPQKEENDPTVLSCKSDYPNWMSLEHFSDVSVMVFVGGAGMRIGISPGEIIDFLLGWTTLDIAGDDTKPAKKKEEPDDSKQ